MPRPPLPEPADPKERLLSVGRSIPTIGFLMSTLLAFNGVQLASTALIPLSRRRFNAFNSWAANLWWGWCVSMAKRLYGAEVHVSGDEVPERENAIVVVNHQNMPDTTFMMFFARDKKRLGDMKWLAKDIIKYVPGVGWGMVFINCVFVKRDWTRDAASVEQAFSRLTRNDVPVWLLSFPEGTRITPEKAERSKRYAREHGLPVTDHVMLPRTKGFVASVNGLRNHVRAVYDVTLAYGEEGVPTLWQYIRGLAKSAHIHVRRFEISELPTDDEQLSQWLRERFVEKDRLLERFYRTGSFEDK